MFDFLFKRKPKKSAPSVPAPVIAQTSPPPTAARDAALALARTLQQDEAASIAFLLTCDFADARLTAAQTVQSVAGLHTVLAAMRNTDRRVAKLMQTRLDVLESQRKLQVLASACIADASHVLADTRLTPNQVSELDRRWQALTAVPESVQQEFDAIRTALADRLVAQATLQRSAMDALARLRALPAQAAQFTPDALRLVLTSLDADIAGYQQSPEVSALPKQLLAQCEQAARELRSSLSAIEQQHAARASRCSLLDEWEAAPAESLQQAVLRRSWNGLPAFTDPEQLVEQRFAALLAQVVAAQPVIEPAAQPVKSATPSASAIPESEQKRIFLAALQAMEQALDEGSLQVAAEADKRVRALNLATLRLTDAQGAQLSRLRAELGRLQGWARWGGNVSREELQKAAEALPAQELAIGELAKKIGSLRERWKSLDLSAGPAPKELWHGFDTACTSAYAPVAEHFGKLAEERQKNLALAAELVAGIHLQADALAASAEPDWKVVALSCQRHVQSWQKLGPTERKEKKKLDTAFNDAMQRLREPLSVVRAAEIALREQLIGDAASLSATDRGALDTLRALQERWQECARGLPLERNDEQALWVRFRAACDAAFAKRKEAAAGADAERQQNLQTREALCIVLESAGAEPVSDAAGLLRETAAAWGRAGAVPRAAEEALEARYRAASAVVQRQIDAVRHRRDNAAQLALQAKLELCQQLETAVANGEDTSGIAQMAGQWQALPALAAPLERVLGQRFEQARIAAANADDAYAATLSANRDVLALELLRFEILLSLDSPAGLARERLRLQVDVLQASLKSGQKVVTGQAGVLLLCGLPALVDAGMAARFQRVLEKLVAG
ncbi:DUF349 domain-containing protein [Actimicrobium antarcticum]|uniref:DUF349 domain-containing protein n=1 Tax=Actimicrobium antarcticum TaxID=1051899 RepID=A0ABP7SY95_9BURK